MSQARIKPKILSTLGPIPTRKVRPDLQLSATRLPIFFFEIAALFYKSSHFFLYEAAALFAIDARKHKSSELLNQNVIGVVFDSNQPPLSNISRFVYSHELFNLVLLLALAHVRNFADICGVETETKEELEASRSIPTDGANE